LRVVGDKCFLFQFQNSWIGRLFELLEDTRHHQLGWHRASTLRTIGLRFYTYIYIYTIIDWLSIGFLLTVLPWPLESIPGDGKYPNSSGDRLQVHHWLSPIDLSNGYNRLRVCLVQLCAVEKLFLRYMLQKSCKFFLLKLLWILSPISISFKIALKHLFIFTYLKR
jgi:hypothetical protein